MISQNEYSTNILLIEKKNIFNKDDL